MGSRIKTHPAVKDREDAEALWQGLRDGTIDCLATDHAPHSYEEKFERSWHNASPGADGVETSMALMLNKVNAGELSLERYVAFACENPARIYGLFPRKGTIQIGSDADLVLLDMDLVWSITDEGLYSKNHITPFHGWTIKGRAVLTIVNGKVVMRDGEITGSPAGKLVNPKQTW
jgi:dihydroorotase-like cyclic amidohydrolase